MKYSGISCRIKTKAPLPFYSLKQFLTAMKFKISGSIESDTRNSKEVEAKDNCNIHKDQNKPGRILQANGLPTHRTFRASLAPI